MDEPPDVIPTLCLAGRYLRSSDDGNRHSVKIASRMARSPEDTIQRELPDSFAAALAGAARPEDAVIAGGQIRQGQPPRSSRGPGKTRRDLDAPHNLRELETSGRF
eukprot:scaffold332_cov105-Isochrysis_galbana.AAC.12